MQRSKNVYKEGPLRMDPALSLYNMLSLLSFSRLCDVVSAQGCTPPTPIDGGYYYPIKPIYSYGDQINYTCDSGYHMPSGTGTRRCQGFVAINAYIWSGAEPECARKS